MQTLLPWTLAAALLPAVLPADGPKPDTVKPAWQRLLRGEDARKAARLQQQVEERWRRSGPRRGRRRTNWPCCAPIGKARTTLKP